MQPSIETSWQLAKLLFNLKFLFKDFWKHVCDHQNKYVQYATCWQSMPELSWLVEHVKDEPCERHG